MKHTIRQNGQITQIDCELGSGIFDKNGIEIFEGDIIHDWAVDKVVIFRRGCLMLIDEKDLPNWQTCGGTALNALLFPKFLEVVGHVGG